MLEILLIIILLPIAAGIVFAFLGFTVRPFAMMVEWFEECVGGKGLLLAVALFGAYCVIHSMIVSWP
jgi:hypothetical protein